MELYPEESIEEEAMLCLMECLHRCREVEGLDSILYAHESKLLQKYIRQIFVKLFRYQREEFSHILCSSICLDALELGIDRIDATHLCDFRSERTEHIIRLFLLIS